MSSDERTPLLQSDRANSDQDSNYFKHSASSYADLFGDKDVKALEKLGDIPDLLKSDSKKGLSNHQFDGEEYSSRLRVYGKNALPEKRMKSFGRFVLEALNDKVLIILVVASVVSLSLGLYQDFGPSHDPNEPRINWIEGFAIMIAVLIVVLVSSINDYSKEKQFKKLNDRKDERKVTVKRSGRNKSVPSSQVVVGDLMVLEAGHILTCDAIYITGHDVKCDESGATGESDAIKKCSFDEMQEAKKADSSSNSDCFLLSGSKIIEGSCSALVLAVGQNSFQGRIFMNLRSSQPETTRMQRQLGHLAEQIARVATIVGGVLLVILLVRCGIQLKTQPDRSTSVKVQGFIQAIVISVTLIVVAVPEGLPLAVTLALAFASQRMTKHNLLVRVFEACETMSNANVIISDKTVTQNLMTVVAVLIGENQYEKDENENQSKDHKHKKNGSTAPDHDLAKHSHKLSDMPKHLNDELQQILEHAVAVNSTAFEEDAKSADSEPVFVGSKTETALLRLTKDLDLTDYHDVRDRADIVHMFPFSSERKAMGTAVKAEEAIYFHAKGAPEILIKKCSKRIKSFDSKSDKMETEDLTDQLRKTVQSVLEKYAERSLRTLALCYRKMESAPSEKPGFDDLAEDLTLIALVGIQDPLRPNTTESVNDCHHAGVNVIMCTGDNILTASAIARQCGILTKEGKALEGSAYRKMSTDEKSKAVDNLQVLARSLPEDKEDLVKTLQSKGKIVCATGDGTNDAMAIKKADIGFAMGMAGTEVAKEASDVILMDDNFASIVSAIIWGRCVSDAVRKFLQFQLAVNATAIIITFVSSVAGGDENSVLNAVQLLWVNLIMDTFAALALATDRADRKLLDRKPEDRSAPIMTVTMIKMILAQAAFQTAITLLLHFGGIDIIKPFVGHHEVTAVEFKTLVFNTFVWCQIFNLINCRRIDNGFNIFEGCLHNYWLLGILAIMVGGQIMIVFIGGPAFGVTPIGVRFWAVSVALGFLSIIIGALVRLLPDGPLLWLLVRLHIFKDAEALPTTNETQLEKARGSAPKYRQMIKHIRSGRHKANQIHYFYHRHDKEPGSDKPAVRGLVVLPQFLLGSS